jgi:hypothetical protein
VATLFTDTYLLSYAQVAVQLHRPMFSSGELDELDLLLQKTYHSLFLSHAVDLVLCGHMHYYERMCAIGADLTCVKPGAGLGPVYIVDGSAGAEFDPMSMPRAFLTRLAFILRQDF